MANDIGLIIACEVFKSELGYFKDQINVDIVWIKHSLHDFPEQLNETLREKIAAAETHLPPGSTILLFFGNCGGALEGIQSNTLHISYPEVPDCIPVILGSVERFKKLHAERPGTFYLNKAWIDSGGGPLNALNNYIERYGDLKGWKVARKMYKNYTHFVLVTNNCYDVEPYKNHVLEACEKLDKVYAEETGNLDFISAILKRSCPMVEIPPKNHTT